MERIIMDFKQMILEPKTEALGLRVTKSEKKFVDEEAKKQGVSVTTLIRSMILDSMFEAQKVENKGK